MTVQEPLYHYYGIKKPCFKDTSITQYSSCYVSLVYANYYEFYYTLPSHLFFQDGVATVLEVLNAHR